jgi:hypothetical protein
MYVYFDLHFKSRNVERNSEVIGACSCISFKSPNLVQTLHLKFALCLHPVLLWLSLFSYCAYPSHLYLFVSWTHKRASLSLLRT